MNPVGGGKLTGVSPVFSPLVTELECASLAELSTRWVLSNPNVDTIISGISKKQDVADAFAALAMPAFTDAQLERINAFVSEKDTAKVGFCTRCGYCMPCPQEVNIPHIMDAVYHQRFLGLSHHALWAYNALGKYDWLKGANGAACIACGECLPKCTQHLDIPAEMAWAHRELLRPNPA
jgi:predicted aldo/keto reductase-like oxidoreductase